MAVLVIHRSWERVVRLNRNIFFVMFFLYFIYLSFITVTTLLKSPGNMPLIIFLKIIQKMIHYLWGVKLLKSNFHPNWIDFLKRYFYLSSNSKAKPMKNFDNFIQYSFSIDIKSTVKTKIILIITFSLVREILTTYSMTL